MSFAVPRSKREPGRRAGGLARIFMKSMKEIKQNIPTRISNKGLTSKTANVSEALPHNVQKNVENDKKESITVEKLPSSSHVEHRKHPTEKAKISERDKVCLSAQGENINFHRESGSSLAAGSELTEWDIEGKDGNNNTVSRTPVQGTVLEVTSGKSALSEKLAINCVSNVSVVMDSKVDSVEIQCAADKNVSNKRDGFKSSRFLATQGANNRGRQEKNSVFNRHPPRRYSQRRHSNNSLERVVEKVELEDWSTDLLKIENEDGCFYESTKTVKSSGFSVGNMRNESKINMGQTDKLKDEKENIKCGNLSERDQQKCNTPGRDQQEWNAPGRDQQKCNIPGRDQREWNTPGRDQQEFNTPGRDQQQCNTPGRDQQQCNTPGRDQQQCKTPGRDQQQWNTPGRDQQKWNTPGRDQQECNTPGRDQQECNIPGRDQQECNTPSRDQQECNTLSRDQQECSTPGRDQQQCNTPGRDQQECNVPGRDQQECNTPGRDQQECNVPGRDQQECNTPGRDQRECNVPGRDQQEYNVPGRDQQKCNTPGRDQQEYNVPGGDQQECNRPCRDQQECNTPGRDQRECNSPGRDQREWNTPGRDQRECNSPGRDQQEWNTPGRDQRECNTPSRVEKECCIPGSDVNFNHSEKDQRECNVLPGKETELNVDRLHENIMVLKKSLDTGFIDENSSDGVCIVGSNLDKENTCGNELLSGKTLDISAEMMYAKEFGEGIVNISNDKEQVVPDFRDCEIEQDSKKQKEKVLYQGCDAYCRKDRNIKTDKSRNIEVKSENDFEPQKIEKLETTAPSSLVGLENNTVKQSEKEVVGNEECSDVVKEQQYEMENGQKCEPVNSSRSSEQEIQDCRKDGYDQKGPLNLEDLNIDDEKEDMRIETPPLRVPVCDIPAYYNRRRNSSEFAETSNKPHLSLTSKISTRDARCCDGGEGKTTSIPSLLDIKCSPWQDYSSASSDSSSTVWAARPRPKKPKKKSKYNQSIARGHTLTVSPIQRSPSGSPTFCKDIKGRQSTNDTKSTYDRLINSKVQALSVEMKAKVSTPPDSSGRTMVAKPIMYRDSLRAMKQVRKNNPGRQVHFEQKKLHTSKMEPIIIAQVSSEPKTMDNLESNHTERRRRQSHSESSKDETSDSARHSKSKPIIIPQDSSEPATEEFGKFIDDNTCKHTVIPQISSEPKFQYDSESNVNICLANTGEIKPDSLIQDRPDFRDHHHSESTADARLRSGFQIHSEQTGSQKGTSESTRAVSNIQESTPEIQNRDKAYEFKDQHCMEHRHRDTSESMVHLHQEANKAETSQTEDICNLKIRHSENLEHEDHLDQEAKNLESPNLDVSKSREYDHSKFGIEGTTDSQQQKSFKGHNSSENVGQENSSLGHSRSETVKQDKSSHKHSSSARQDKTFQGYNMSSEGHHTSEHRRQESSARVHSSSKSVQQNKSFQSHTSSQPVRPSNSSGGHNSRGHNRSQPSRQSYNNHNRMKPIQQDQSFSTQSQNSSETARKDSMPITHNRSEHVRKENYSTTHNTSDPIKKDRMPTTHHSSEPVRKDNSSSTCNSSEPVRKDNSSSTCNSSEPVRKDNSFSTCNSSEPVRKDNSSSTCYSSEPVRKDNSFSTQNHSSSELVGKDKSCGSHDKSESSTDIMSKPEREDNSSAYTPYTISEHSRQDCLSDNRSEPTMLDNSSGTPHKSELIRKDNSSTTVIMLEPKRLDNFSTTENSSGPTRQDNLFQDQNRSRFSQKNDSSHSYHSSESRKYRSSESSDPHRSQYGKHCSAERGSYHRDRSGSRCFYNNFRSNIIVQTEPKCTNSNRCEPVSSTTLKRQNSSENQSNKCLEKEQGSKSSDAKHPGQGCVEFNYLQSQKKLGENLNTNVSLKHNWEANDKQVESSEYENWDKDLLPVVTPPQSPDSNVDLSADRVKFTKEGVSTTNVGMLSEDISGRKLAKMEEKDQAKVPKSRTTSYESPAIKIEGHDMDKSSLSESCGKDVHNQSLQDKTYQQHENKCNEAKCDVKSQVGQPNFRSCWPDYKTDSVTFRGVRNERTCPGQENSHNTDTGQRNTICKTCGRQQLESSSNTPYNCICQRTSDSKGEHLTLNVESFNTGWCSSSKQRTQSVCQQGNYDCGMEQNVKKSNYRKDLNRIEDNGKSSKNLMYASKDECQWTVDPKWSKLQENNDKKQEKLLLVQSVHISGHPTQSKWRNKIDDRRKNEERKCPWVASDQQQKPVLYEPEENWDSHLLDIEGILKTQGKTETTEQVVPGEREFKEKSILSNNNPTGKPREYGSRTRHQLEEWESTSLDLNLIGSSASGQEDNRIPREEESFAERHVNNEWCEVQTSVENVHKVKAGLPSACVMSACVNNGEEEDGSIIPQSESSFGGTQETSEFEDGCTSDDVLDSYVFLSQEECCAQDVPLDSTTCTQTSTDQEMDKMYHKPRSSPWTYRPPVSSQTHKTRNADVDVRGIDNDHRHRPDLNQKRGRPPGYGPEACVCPPSCVQFWTWRCCFCHWGWEPRICDIRSALDYSDYFSPLSAEEDKDSAEHGMRMRYSPRGLLAMRSNSAIPPPPSRELWNQMQQGCAPMNSLSPRGTGPSSSPANMPQTRKPFPQMQYPGSYPYPQDYGSQPQQVMSHGMRHCSPYQLQFRPSLPCNDGAPINQNRTKGNSNDNSESSGYVSRDHTKKSSGELGKHQSLGDSRICLTSTKESVSSDEMQDLQLNSPKLVDYGFSETDDSEEEKKEQLVRSRIVLFGKDDQSQDSDCSSEKRKHDVEEQELNDDQDCGVGPKRRHMLPQSNIYHFIRHSLNTEVNKKEDDQKATAYVPPHRRQKITLGDGPESDDQRAKENERKQASSKGKHADVSSPVSKPGSSGPGSYPWTPFWASPPPPAMGMSVSPLFGYHQTPCMYPQNCYFSPPNWYHTDSGTDSYGGAYPQSSHSLSTNSSAVKSSSSPHPTKNMSEPSKLQGDRRSPERLVLPPRIQFLERTRLLGNNTDSESSSSYRLVDWKVNFKEKCKSYSGTFIDSHCHLDFLFNRQGFKGTWSKYKIVNEGTMPDCFEGCVAVFCHPGSFRQEGLWKEIALEEDVWLAFGCHPKNATEFSPRAEEGLIRCLQHKRVVALGEIGLDYSGIFKQHKTSQKIVFIKQIQLALEMNKPLVIHCREAEEDALQILEETVPRNYRIHCHCFTGNYESAKKWMNLFPNLYIGLTPLVTYRTATPTHEVARFIPLDRLLLETDAPYFIPRKFPKEDVHFSHPGMAITVAEHVAFLKRCSVTEVLHACRQNTRTMYGI